MLTARLRLATERGQSVSLHRPCFYFKDVFLFDPIAKPTYAIGGDTEGVFQGQPLHVKMDGGCFVPDCGKTTLVSAPSPGS